jgi:multidrug efflux pump subunit AcrA (membrane-fusion protein)
MEGDSPSWEVDDRYTILEMHVDYDLPGYESEDGIALPYVITIDKQSRTVLSIRRNWREEDPLKQKRLHFIHYPYLPGLGFYGSGLIHLIGGIAKSSTSIIRQLIDAGTLSNLPAGLKARGLRIKGDSAPLMPGEFRDVDVASGAIKDSITFLPYKEPSAVLYQLLGTLTEEGRRIGSIADVSVADMNPNAPVGTTLALLERNLKVMSAVQARVHAAMSKEFELIAQIVKDYMSADYEYDVGEGDYSRHEDFDERVDIIPVSDPNASTMAQRVMQYESAIQMSQNAPQIYNLPLLHREMLQVLNIKGFDDIVKLPEEMKPMDPVSENMAVLKQDPVKAFEDQDHEAHLAVHMTFSQDPRIMEMVGQSPNAQSIQSAMMAHIAEHIGFAYRNKIQTQLGIQLPTDKEELPPETQANIAQIEAMAAQKVLQEGQAEAAQKQAQEQAQDPLIQMQQAEIQIKAQEAQRKAEKDAVDAQLKAERLKLDAERLASQERIAGAKIMAGMETADNALENKIVLEAVKASTKLMGSQ